MTSIARYTQNQQDLINEFRVKEVSNIAIKQKAPTTTLIKSIVKKKDQQLLEELLPMFIEYYDTNRSKSDKSTFESKFLKTLKNTEDQQFFENIYKKDNGAELEDNIIKVKVDGKDSKPRYAEEIDLFQKTNKPKTYAEEYDLFQPPVKPKKPKTQPDMPSSFPSVNKPQGKGFIETPIKKPIKPKQPKSNQDLMNELDTKSISSIFNTGSKLYTQNKKMVDSVGNSIMNNDGSFFTTLASMSQPEIAILQQLTNITPLAYNDRDNQLLQSLIHKNKGQYAVNDATGDEYAKMYAKLLFNPDAIGKMVQGSISNSFEDLVDWGKKAVGIKAPDPNAESDKMIKDIVSGRINEGQAVKDRQKAIDIAKGKKVWDDNVDLSLRPKKPTKTAADFLTPPDIKQYGYHERNAFEDVANFFQKLMGQRDLDGNPADYMNLLKTKNPALYDKYQKELKDYEMRKAKVQLDANSSFQNAVGGKSLSYITSLLDNITREPGALADLTEEQIGDIYDGVNFLKSVSEGKKQGINYQTIQDLSQSIFDEMPLSIMEKYKPKLDNINEVIRSEFTKQFEGDSDLMSELNFNTSARVEPSEETKAEVDIGEQPIETKPDMKTDEDTKPDDTKPQPEEDKPPEDATSTAIKADITERSITSNKKVGDLRPRLEWGGTDKLIATKEEVNLMNAISDSMSLDEVGWGNGSENTLFNINNIDNEKRYSRTFAMPPAPKEDPTTIPYNFYQTQRPQFTSQLPPISAISSKLMRDNMEFGQYQQLAERCNLSSTNMNAFIKSQPNEFPAQIDERTGGNPLRFNRDFDYVVNQRFLIKR